ncbi:ribonuclease P protein component [Corynebacterium tuscaniense]|uniref:Ribonuclease P protein component n=1 Tax=Corynebacterium tuscaniense TaxID=302449 RepID=A0A2N6T645_9CORY|nr:ribonuclease P protein component [Corynebacterium tuscaniense]PMC64798.1 ribonuclease P protein component [Corynebacterium tuscaniense]
MLPRPHKLTSSADFRRAMRNGGRAGTRTVVVHYYTRTEPIITGGPRFGLVVSKQVGNAVVRHRVSRQLRHVCLGLVDKLPRETDVVLRALPASADASSEDLRKDLANALKRAAAKHNHE